jgi:ACT domain-containing protein
MFLFEVGVLMSKSKTVSTTEAIQLVGVSRATFWRLVKRYNITTFQDVLDRRVKLIRREDVQRLLSFAQSVRNGEETSTPEAYERRAS